MFASTVIFRRKAQRVNCLLVSANVSSHDRCESERKESAEHHGITEASRLVTRGIKRGADLLAERI